MPEQGMRLSKTVGICPREFMGAWGALSDPCSLVISILVGETDLFTESNYAGNKNQSAPRCQRKVSSAVGRENADRI